jgi:hypothetical protein
MRFASATIKVPPPTGEYATPPGPARMIIGVGAGSGNAGVAVG